VRFTLVAIVAGLALPLSAAALPAQAAPASIAARDSQLRSAARLRAPHHPLLSSERSMGQLELVSARPSRRDGEVFMIVGGALLLTGLLVDETLISIAGVGIGAYGVYVYLNSSPKRS
jgi:hypothetical protein